MPKRIRAGLIVVIGKLARYQEELLDVRGGWVYAKDLDAIIAALEQLVAE